MLRFYIAVISNSQCKGECKTGRNVCNTVLYGDIGQTEDKFNAELEQALFERWEGKHFIEQKYHGFPWVTIPSGHFCGVEIFRNFCIYSAKILNKHCINSII